MTRKASRMAGGKLKDCKDRGEWAELYFMMMAAGLGMRVLRLFGQTGRYDVGVEGVGAGNEGRLLRVQVKSTIYKRRNGEYSLNVMGPRRQKYEPGTVDYFAILLIPRDDWYIIPFEVMGRTNSSIHFTPKGKRQKYGEYREAWHLLKRTGLTIQACGEEEEAASGVRDPALGWLRLCNPGWASSTNSRFPSASLRAGSHRAFSPIRNDKRVFIGREFIGRL